MKYRILALLLIPVLLVSCGKKEPNPEVLVVGMELAYPPFEMTDTDNKPTGVSVDLANAFADYLGKSVRIENIPFAGLIPALQTGKIDIVISSMTATEERSKTISFSDPYLSTGLCMLVSNDSTLQNIGDLDVPGMTVAVKQGTTGHLYANERIQNADIIVFDKETTAVLEVSQKKADAFIYDQMSTFKNWKSYPDTTKALLAPFQKEGWAIGLRHDSDELRAQANAFIADFKESGGFKALGEKYLSEQKDAFAELGIPFYF